LSKFGWDYAIPDAQVDLLASLKRLRTGHSENESSAELPDRSRGGPFPVKLSGVESDES
jgi:hemoglobin